MYDKHFAIEKIKSSKLIKRCFWMILHEFKKIIERVHFDSQKHDFNFGRENAYHIIFINENCMISFLL